MSAVTQQLWERMIKCMQSHLVTVYCSNVNLVRVHLLHFFLQFVLCAKRLVPDIDVIFKCEGELSVLEIILLH